MVRIPRLGTMSEGSYKFLGLNIRHTEVAIIVSQRDYYTIWRIR